MVEKEWIKIGKFPFRFTIKISCGYCRHGDQGIIFVAGAPETLFMWVHDFPSKTKIELGDFLQQGLRVVAVAQKIVDLTVLEAINSDREKIEKLISHDLKFLGLCGIQDAIRPDVASVIAQTRQAGLRIIMATGDHQETALYVAKDVGIFHEGDKGN